MTFLGTRPEIIRLRRVIFQLDRLCEHILVNTGQNFTASLSDIFFQQLGVRAPDFNLAARGDTMGEQIGKIISLGEQIILSQKPDRI